MAAIFTLRKGTSNYSTIADAELYLHQGSGSIQFGSGSGNPVTLLPLNVPANGNIRLTGDITASNAYFTNNVRIDGNIILGDGAAGDTIQSLGVFTTNLIPQGNRNVGSTDAYWSNVYATSISGAIAATNGVISGSAQIPSLLPSGIVSGSSQIVLRSTDGFSTYDSAISTITGSLIASASTAKTANDLQDVNIINLNLTTASLNTSVSNLNTTTASLNTSVSNLNTATASINLTTASLNTSVSNLNTTTASLKISVSNLELFSSSQLEKDLNLQTYTSSVNTRLTEIGVVSGSLIASASSFETRFGTIANYSTSVNARLTEIGVVSGSLIASASAVSTSVWYLNQTSQSLEIRNTTLAGVTSSYDTRWSTLANYTGSNDTTNTNQNSRLSALEVSSASVHSYTASLKTALDVNGQNLTVYGNLTVQGTQTTLNTNEVIVEDKTLTLASGSTTAAEADGAGVQIAGANVTMSWDNSNTRVLFNTNLGIIGSISSSTLVGLNGASVALYSSSVSNRLTNLESFTSSTNTRLTEIGVVSGSLIASASSFEIRNATLATYTASVNTRLTEIGVVSGSLIASASSFETRNATLANVTSSINNRLTEIGVVSGSLIASASAVSASVWHLHQFSSSQLEKDLNLQTYTSSVNNKFNDLQTYTSSVNTRLTEIGVVSGSLIASASSFQTRFGAVATISGSLISTASNHETRVVVLESTASYLQGLFSTSVDSRLDNLEAASSSFSSSIFNLNGFSSSQLEKDLNLQTYTGSVNTRLTEIGVVTGSLIISASNAKTTNDAQDISISKLNDATASLFISASTLTASFTALRSEFNTLTASVDPGNVSAQFSNINVRFDTLATLTGSYDARFTQIGVVTGSLILSASNHQISISNLNSFTASQSTASLVNRLNAIESVSGSWITESETGSYETRFATIGTYTGSNDTKWTDLQIHSSSWVTTAITASSVATASITGTSLTFTKGDNSQFTLSIPTGSAVSASYAQTASLSERTTQVDILVKNVSGAQINKGKVVRISGATGDNPLIVTASFLTEGQSANTLGITTQNIPNDSFGYVITEGVLLGVDTTGMTAGQLIYLGANGTFTTTPPTAPNHGVRLGEVLRDQQNNGSIYVRIDNGSELGEAHDVVDSTTNSSYGDVLMKSGSVWINNSTFSSSISSFSSSTNISVTNINSFTSSQLTQNSVLATYTGSNDTKWSTLGSLSGSFARTNSANTFNGNQIVSGSLTVTQDFIVLGSSSITNVSSSTLNIGTNLITVAVNQPSVRFGGLAVIDSGSANASGSFLYDSVQDEFIFVHRGDGVNITSSHFVLGPETYNNLGNETYLTNNRLPKGTGKEHIVDSNITDNGTTITLGSNTVVTGTLVASGTSLVSASAQINGTQITNNTITIAGTSTALGGTITLATITGNSGILSGSGQLGNYETTGRGIVSGSSQITPLLPAGTVSGSSQVIGILSSLNTYTGSNDTLNTAQNSRLTLIESATGSYETKGRGIVSGSSQIDATLTTNWATGIKTQLNSNTVISGSSQVYSGVSGDITIASNGVATIAANSVALGTDTTGDYVASLVAGTNITLSNNSGEGATPTIGLTNNSITIAGTSTSLGGTITLATITGGSGIVSGSSQVTYSSLSGIPSGIVSGAAQITPLLPAGTVSGSSQVYSGVSGDITIASNGVATIANNSVLLGTDTVGSYVASLVEGTGVTITNNSGEGATPTIAIGQAVNTSSNVQFNSLGVGMAASATAGRIDATNDIVAFSSSDKRFKDNIKPIENALEKIESVGGYEFDWKEENKIEHGYDGHDIGVIAQEIEAIAPELVQTRENGYKAVKYDKIVPLLIEAIKELSAKVKELENK